MDLQHDPLFDDAARQLNRVIFQLELNTKEANRDIINKQIAEIPQMSDRQLLEAIYYCCLTTDKSTTNETR